MLAGALSISNRLVREIMTPRRRLVTIEASTLIADALAELSASAYSRFPVTEDGEEIVGLVTLRDLFLANEQKAAATVADVVEEPMIVSEVYEVPLLLTTFSQEGMHAAIVVNEFGSISGMVTREDAIEEILGEFNDEFDIEPDPITITGSTVSVRGDVLLTVLNERFELAFPVDEVDTVSGYVWHHLGRPPEEGDTVPLVTRRSTVASDSTDDEIPQTHRPLRVDSVDGTLVDWLSFTLAAYEPDEDRGA